MIQVVLDPETTVRAPWVLRLEPWEHLSDRAALEAWLAALVPGLVSNHPVSLALWRASPQLEDTRYTVRCYRWSDGWKWRYRVEPEAFPTRVGAEPWRIEVPQDVCTIQTTQTYYTECRRKATLEALDSIPPEELHDPAARAHYGAIREACEAPLRLALVVITREIDASLLRMLESAGDHVDEIVLVATHPVDWGVLERNPELRIVTADFRPEEYIELLDGSTSICDFSAARNFAHSLATATWHMFLDSDDTLEFSGETRLNAFSVHGLGRLVNAVNMRYDYEADEKGVWSRQNRMCMWRWRDEQGNPMWQWQKPVHELCVPTAWNPGTVVVDMVKNPTAWYIKHHAGDPQLRVERNGKIILWAINSGRVTGVQATQLKHALAASLPLEEAVAAEVLFREVLAGTPDSTFGLVAAVDLADLLRLTGRYRDARDILREALDSWPAVPQLLLGIARCYYAEGHGAQACVYFKQVYLSGSTVTAEYRTNPQDFERNGRLEAARCFLDEDEDASALVVLEQVPRELREASWTNLERLAQVRLGDAAAAEHARQLVYYLLSCDCVEKADQVVRALTAPLRRLEPVANARYLVHRRLEHVERPEAAALERAYDVLNGRDLQVTGRRHLHHILRGVILSHPDVLIDIGCNTGWLCLHVKQALPECQVLGVDVGAQRVACAQARARELGLDVQFVVAEGLPDRHPIGARVAVCASEVLEHVWFDQEFVAAVATIADEVFITVPDVERYHMIQQLARRPRQDADVVGRTIYEEREHVRCYDAHELADLWYDYVGDVRRLDASEADADQSLLYFHGRRTFTCHPDRQLDIVCDGYVDFGPRLLETGHMGGSEQAVCHLAPLFTEAFDTHVWARPTPQLDVCRGVRWHHYGDFDPMACRAALIVWRRADLLRGARQACEGRCPVYYWGHDVPHEDDRGRFELADEVWALSQFHAGLYAAMGVPEEKIHVLQNGVDTDAVARVHEARHDHRVVYASSPDRGLLHLLRMWPRVRDEVPDAELHFFYGDRLMRPPFCTLPGWFRVADEIRHLGATLPGVVNHGGVAHAELLHEMARSAVWAYPTHFLEISCIVAMETQALGVWPVTTSLGALPETVREPTTDHEIVSAEVRAAGAEPADGTMWYPEGCYSQTFLDHLLDALVRPPSEDERRDLSQWAQARFHWGRTARLFLERLPS
jgi:glycosyltransferase involved in cell wall biosynthesis